MPDAAPEAAPDFTARRSVRTALLATAGVSMLAGLYAALLLVIHRLSKDFVVHNHRGVRADR